MRIAMIISYDGTNYCGWQRQNNGESVQNEIEKAINKITGEDIAIVGAGRTDAGVHAIGQCAHFDTNSSIIPEKFSYAINTLLPADIRIKQSFLAEDDFHARYSAIGKTYKYYIYNSKHASSILRNYTLHEPRKLDIYSMEKALDDFLGEHDFSAFCASGAQVKTFTRCVTDASMKVKNDIIEFSFSGNGFLYNMVRIMVGTLIYIGVGKITPDMIPSIIKSKDRTKAGITVPPQGLFLYKVKY